MAHSLGLSVIAEGVGTEETLKFLRGASYDEAQGYFIAMPMPIEELETFLLKNIKKETT